MSDWTLTLATMEDAAAALQAGVPVLVADDAERENEVDVVLAGDTLTDEWMAWTVRHSSGYVCAPMPTARADELELPLMVQHNADPLRTAYTVTVDARRGVTTGISAADRATTVRVLASGSTVAGDLIRPGHVLPLRAVAGGVLARRGHTEAAVDLCRIAGLAPVAAIAELVDADGTMMRLPAAAALAATTDLPLVTIAQLVAWRQRYGAVERVTRTTLATAHGTFEMLGYRDTTTGQEHLVLVSPRGLTPAGALVRLHSECLTGDAFGSQRCACGSQLDLAQRRVAAEGGALVYLRGHEGRGVGLLRKLQAYELQDIGFDTVDAQTELGLPVDGRDYAAGAAILVDLGLSEVRLLTNNPLKVAAVRQAGIAVPVVEPLQIHPVAANRRYLQTKRDRLGHTLGHLGQEPADTGQGSATGVATTVGGSSR
jgi:3,4-dihydroxy 2-butanone 4-phosphate synthase/GTP cyclohydrolase II